MPLMPCRDCGHECSTKALACPQCGRFVRARGWWAVTIGWGIIMSAVISVILSILIFVFAGVGLAGLTALLNSQSAPAPRATPTPFR
jgi:hypothetical protein